MCLEKIFGFFFKPREIVIAPIERKFEPEILANTWRVVSAIEPEDIQRVLLVTYTNELGMMNECRCMVVFENNTEYKLVSPELGSGKILQKANLVDLKIDHIEREKS
jgi:hypothetical protein